MPRTVASCLVLALLAAASRVQALYPTTGCDGEPAVEPTTAKAFPPDPILMAQWILGYDPRLTIDAAELLGAPSAASLLDTCQVQGQLPSPHAQHCIRPHWITN